MPTDQDVSQLTESTTPTAGAAWLYLLDNNLDRKIALETLSANAKIGFSVISDLTASLAANALTELHFDPTLPADYGYDYWVSGWTRNGGKDRWICPLRGRYLFAMQIEFDTVNNSAPFEVQGTAAVDTAADMIGKCHGMVYLPTGYPLQANVFCIPVELEAGASVLFSVAHNGDDHATIYAYIQCQYLGPAISF